MSLTVETVTSVTGETDRGESATTEERGSTADPAERSDPGGSPDQEATESDPEKPPESAVDDAAESFVDLERDLQAFRGEGDRIRGRAVDARRLSTSEIPVDYPERPGTADALELLVRPEGTDTTPQPVYFEWPPGEEGPLATLLALRDVDPASFADLHGESVPLAVEDGWLVPDLPETPPRGSKRGLVGIGLSLAIMAGAAALSPVASTGSIAAVWAVVTLGLLPVSTYYDAWYLRTQTDWKGGPLFWTTLMFLPYLNLIVLVAYLVSRRSADPL